MFQKVRAKPEAGCNFKNTISRDKSTDKGKIAPGHCASEPPQVEDHSPLAAVIRSLHSILVDLVDFRHTLNSRQYRNTEEKGFYTA